MICTEAFYQSRLRLSKFSSYPRKLSLSLYWFSDNVVFAV